MPNQHILISGPTITKDEDLVNKLTKIAEVLRNSQNSRIEAILKKHEVDLILVEILKEAAFELKFIKNIKSNFPSVAIIFINGDRELMAEAFSHGVNDAFRKPYKSSLVVERVKAVLGGLNHMYLSKKSEEKARLNSLSNNE